MSNIRIGGGIQNASFDSTNKDPFATAEKVLSTIKVKKCIMKHKDSQKLKSTALLVFCILFSLPSFPQHFDWVKSYIGESDNNGLTDLNTIIGSAVDNEGSLYILGEFTKGAQIDNTDLLPFSPYGIDNKTKSVVIAKLSPAGQLMWHKPIHTNYGSPTNGIGIQLVGDTSIVCMVMLSRPGVRNQNYTYFLDTLFLETNNFAFPTDSVNGAWFLAYLEFGLDGHLKDKHFLSAACINSDGTIMMKDSCHYRDMGFNCDAFSVDDDGNIIMAHPVISGTNLFDDSTFWGYRLLINGGERHFDVHVPAFTSYNNYQIIKFSPRFTNILHQQLLFEPNIPNLNGVNTYITSLMSPGKDNSIYLLLSMNAGTVAVLDSVDFRITGMPDTRIQTGERCPDYSVILRYDSVLNPQWLFQLDYENNSNNHELWNCYLFNALSIDENGDVYCLGRIWSLHQEQIYRADTFNINVRNGIFFARLDKNTGRALAIGEIRSSRTTVPQLLEHIEIATHNNFVIVQLLYQHNIYIRDSVITRPMSTGLFVWDKDGHEVQFIDYNSPSPTNDPRGTVLHDSILYLSGRMNGGGTFGNYTLPAGEDRAYVLKYIDTFFATPYVYVKPNDTTNHGGGGEVRITVVGDEGAFVAYPNPFRQRVTIEVQGGVPLAATAWLTDLTGRREEIRLTATGNGQYTLDLTSRPQATYLLTVTTADGRQITLRLLKQSDIFGH